MTALYKLNQLQPGEHGVIQHVHAEPMLALRLNAMGFRIGKRVALIRTAPFSGPMQVRIGSTDIIIRSDDAQHIELSGIQE